MVFLEGDRMTKKELEILEMEHKLNYLMDEVVADYYSDIGDAQLDEINDFFDLLVQDRATDENHLQRVKEVFKLTQAT